VLLACSAWAVLAIGLFADPVDERASGELEAGGRFAINIALYLPYLFLSAAVVLAAVLSVLPRPGTTAPAVILVVVTTAFSLWTLWFQDLYGARPDLPGRALVALGFSLAAVLPLVPLRRRRPPGARHERLSGR